MLTTISLFLYSFSSPPPVSTRRRSLVVPKSYTFAPNLTPISYPSDRTSPTDENTPPSPLSPSSSASPTQSPAGERELGADADTKSENMDDASANTVDLPMPPPTRPRRRGPRRDSVEHIPRPPNAFMLFRQNFVHQRHVPGSIETNHNSLSRIVGEYTPLIIQLCFSHFPPLLRWLRRPYAPSRPSSPPVKPTFLFGFGSASILPSKIFFHFPAAICVFIIFLIPPTYSQAITGKHSPQQRKNDGSSSQTRKRKSTSACTPTTASSPSTTPKRSAGARKPKLPPRRRRSATSSSAVPTKSVNAVRSRVRRRLRCPCPCRSRAR